MTPGNRARELRSMRAASFPALLAAPRRAVSAHFIAHHARQAGDADELSTDSGRPRAQPVDELGLVVPKRHARRAVTRNLIRRQLRAAMQRHGDALDPGSWLLRLRAGFDGAQFRSASSSALRAALRAELDDLLARASRR
jgi:ribonuclease P protein component